MDSYVPEFSVVILTYNREKYLAQQLPGLSKIPGIEIIVVDNNSESPYATHLAKKYHNVTVVNLDKNYGAVGRNFGITAAKSDFVITLDDDVWGITEHSLNELRKKFSESKDIVAICFKVLDEITGEVCNWCHHADPKIFSNKSFDTYSISEGAVAFRRSLFDSVGLYPLEFFISHEGPDLAYRILNFKARMVYLPAVEVIHAHALEGRKSWRRYYYDTRNTIWLAYRNYTWKMILTKLPLQLAAMFVYSVRDGFFKYYTKAIIDGIREMDQFKGTRRPVSNHAVNRMKDIDRIKPGIFFYIKKRLIRKGVRI